MDQAWTIGQLAKSATLNPSAIRYYEKEGLLKPATRSANGYRRYSHSATNDLLFIKTCQHLGLSIDDIRGILKKQKRRGVTCFDVETLLTQKLGQIESDIQKLQKLRKTVINEIQKTRNPGDRPCCAVRASLEKILESPT